MSTLRTDVDEADRLARVTLSRTIEPGDLRVTGLGSELGAGKILGEREAARRRRVPLGPRPRPRTHPRVNPAQVLERAAARGIRCIVPR